MNALKKHIESFLILILILPTITFGESSVFALLPKSVGEHYYPYSVAAQGRGGFSMAIVDSVGLNQMNYALWTNIPRTTFTVGMTYQGLATESPTHKIGSLNGSFLGGYLAIPLLVKKITIGFGVQPKSINNQGYTLKNSGLGVNATQTFKAKGDLSEVQFITAFAPIQDLSFGLYVYYVFGKISDNTIISYTDISYADISVQNEYRFYGKHPSIGLSGFLRLTPRMTIGARLKIPSKTTVYSQQKSIAGEKKYERYQEITFPLNLTFGMAWHLDNGLVLGGDFDYINWKNGYLFDGSPLSYMTNSFRIGAGAELKPSARRLASYTNRMNYRAGIFWGQMNFLANGHPVNEYGIGLGIGLPVNRESNRIDIALQVGKRGSISINGLSEMFLRLNFSISADELWFAPDER